MQKNYFLCISPDCLTMLKTSAMTINRVVSPKSVDSVVDRFLALEIKVTITGINAVTSATSTITLVIEIAPFTDLSSFALTMIN